MGSPADLSLDYKPNSCLTMQKQMQGEQPDQTQKIQDFLTRLEEERFKIEAFKRELPLCMQLLNNAVEAYRQQLEAHQTCRGPEPVLEEFIPLKSVDGSDKATNAPSEKANWMISAQLWSPANDATKPSPGTPPAKDVADHGFEVVVSPKLALDVAKQRNGGGFLPFSKEKNKGVVAGKSLPEAAVESPPHKVLGEKKCLEVEINGVGAGRRENGTIKGSGGAEQGINGGTDSQTDQGQGQAQAQALQPHRKARRCWSPDLHRRFVNALQILGGSQVATPKQIRELMKVDGLTNDEVKSHLQKYRLHTRRPIPPPPAPAAAAAPQLVVLGGIWVPPEYATSAAGPAAIYGAHPAPAHYCTAATAAVPQEYYPPPLQVHHPLHHHVHRPTLHRSVSVPGGYKGRVSSPESEGRSGAEQSESIEEDEQQEREEREDEEETEAEEDEEDEGHNKTAAEEKAPAPLGAKADDGGLRF